MSDDTKNILLYDTERERQLIGMFLYGPYNGYFAQCETMLQPDDFEDIFCQDVWKVMLALSKDHSSVDMTSVYNRAPSMGITIALKDLVDLDLDRSVFDYPLELAAYLSDLALRRKMQAAMFKQALNLNDLDRQVTDIISDARHALDGAVQQMPTDVSNMDVYRDSIKEWQERANGDTTDGIICGFHYIDRRGGLQPSDLNIVAGRTSVGKTSLAIAMALNAARNGTAVAIFSLEMSLKQLFARMTAMVSGVSSTRLQYSALDDETFQIAFDGAASIATLPIYYDASRVSNIRMIEQGIRRMKMNYGVKLVIVDYAQLLTDPKAKDERTRVGGAANALKALAVELNICIILVSQIRRLQQGQSPVPTISMLKESGDLENAADNIYLVYRPSLHNTTYPDLCEQWSQYDPNGTGLVINGKSRNAGIGEFLLEFVDKLTLYRDFAGNPPLLTSDSAYVTHNEEKPPF